MSLTRFAAAVGSLGPEYLLITDGMAGAYLAHCGRLHHVSTVDVKVAGTAGAGDAFSSTFAAFVVRGASIEDSLRAATLNAASVVGYADTQTGLLRIGELERASERQGSQIAVRSFDM
jgi:ribokinase